MDKREEADARYNALRGLFGELKDIERTLDIVAETVDNAECLRTCADALQEVREHYWPMWLRARRERTGADALQEVREHYWPTWLRARRER